MAGPDRFSYHAGVTGTITVAEGYAVSGIACHATGGGATLTITPQGEDTDPGSAGDAIPIPAGSSFAIAVPVLVENTEEIGAGSVLVFAGTDSYFVALKKLH